MSVHDIGETKQIRIDNEQVDTLQHELAFVDASLSILGASCFSEESFNYVLRADLALILGELHRKVRAIELLFVELQEKHTKP